MALGCVLLLQFAEEPVLPLAVLLFPFEGLSRAVVVEQEEGPDDGGTTMLKQDDRGLEVDGRFLPRPTVSRDLSPNQWVSSPRKFCYRSLLQIM